MNLIAIVLLVLSSTLAASAADPTTRPGTLPAPRAARSVHLAYTAPDADVLYNELCVAESHPGSYFMACGFQHGYFGIQELANGKKVVIFSVWDPGDQNDPKAVVGDQRVEVPFQAEDVRIKRFGGEGTGGQCMMDYDWKIGETCRFAVRSVTDKERTAYAAWFYLTESKTWKHLATFGTFTGKTGGNIRGYYSFVEDFRRDTKSA